MLPVKKTKKTRKCLGGCGRTLVDRWLCPECRTRNRKFGVSASRSARRVGTEQRDFTHGRLTNEP